MSIVPAPDFQALRPPIEVRQASSAIASAEQRARRSGRARRWSRADARAVKKSTMMLPRWNWHHGMKSAIAAPAAAPESSKSPTMVEPNRLRPIRLPHVISVTTVSSTPARMAQSLASVSSSRNGVLFFGTSA